MKKVCTKCLKSKKLVKFHKQKLGLYGHRATCKRCRYKVTLTKEAVCDTLYRTQVNNSKKRGHPSPNYNKVELQTWLFNKKKFHKLYKQWVMSHYDVLLKPSCDRTNNSKGYTFKNIKLMTWGENKLNADRDIKNGKIQRTTKNIKRKPVLQLTLLGEFVGRFESINEARLKFNNSHISDVCKGTRKSAGGFIWRYSDDT